MSGPALEPSAKASMAKRHANPPAQLRDYWVAVLTVSQDIAFRQGIREPGPVNVGGVWYPPNEWMGMRLGTKPK